MDEKKSYDALWVIALFLILYSAILQMWNLGKYYR